MWEEAKACGWPLPVDETEEARSLGEASGVVLPTLPPLLPPPVLWSRLEAGIETLKPGFSPGTPSATAVDGGGGGEAAAAAAAEDADWERTEPRREEP